MLRRSFALAVGAVAVALAWVCGASTQAEAQWKPDKPVTIIVPWAAGGSTDQVTRLAAVEIEKALDQKVVVVNQPGASGSIGTKNALTAAPDGYTWTAGAAKDIGTYAVSGLLDTKLTEWRLYLSVINVSVLGTGTNTAYKDANDLVAAMKAKPGQVSVATAGINSSGHSAIESFTRALGLTYKHVSYDGGNPAVIATVAGETEITSQLAVEQASMIRGKQAAAAGGAVRSSAGARGSRHDPRDHIDRAGLPARGQLLRHLRAEGGSGGGARAPDGDLGQGDRELGGAQEVRCFQRRPIRAGCRRRCGQGGDAGNPGLCLAAARWRQIEGGTRYGGGSAALTSSLRSV